VVENLYRIRAHNFIIFPPCASFLDKEMDGRSFSLLQRWLSYSCAMTGFWCSNPSLVLITGCGDLDYRMSGYSGHEECGMKETAAS